MRQRPDRSRAPRSRATRPGPPGSARPTTRRSGAGGRGRTDRTSAPRPGGHFTVRAIVLSVVLVALALSYVFPLRVYLGQRAEIAELRAEQAEQRAHVAALAEEAARWEDEDYIRIQARRRLYFGEPDELLLIPVLEDDPAPPETGFDPADEPPPDGAWWDTLWTSVRSADGTPAADSAAAGVPGG